MIEWLNAKELEFWHGVMSLDPPKIDGSEPTDRALKLFFPESNGEAIKLPDELIDADQRVSRYTARIGELTEKKQLETNRIRAALKDAEVRLPYGAKYTRRDRPGLLPLLPACLSARLGLACGPRRRPAPAEAAASFASTCGPLAAGSSSAGSLSR